MHIEDLDEADGDGGIDHPYPIGLMFDPWLGLSGTMVEAIAPIGQQVLEALRPQGRKPRADLVLGIGVIVPAIIANLMVLHRDRPEGARLVVEMDRRKRTRYDPPGFRKLPEVVGVLEDSGHVIKHKAVYKRLRTTLEATESLKRLLVATDVGLANITRVEGEELIWLTARSELGRIAGRKQPKRLIDYKDTEETIKLREEMAGINRFLSSRSITLEGSPQPAFRLTRRFTLRRPDDPVRFNLHGRLYGGFWMNLKATKRHRLRIDGEPIADLDFASMFPRLAYRHVGKEPPQGDLYAVPGLETHREGAKAGLSALLSYGSEMRSLPSGLRELLPDGWTARHLREAVSAYHPDLAPLFGKDIGLDLMFTESRILMLALETLMARGIPALPMHDGMMVARSHAVAATRAMEAASKEVIGVRLPVATKG